MPKNLEIKVPVNNIEELEKILYEAGANLVYESQQLDVYYKVKNGRLKIRDSSGEKSIIFYQRVESGDDRWSDFTVIKVDNPKEWVEFFDKFLERLVEVNKYRKLLHYKNSRIHLDKIEGLGNFLEIETKLTVDEATVEDEFEFLIDLLKIDKSKQILNSYSDIILNLKDK